MSTDAIVLLKKDHQEVRTLFSRFEKLGENAHKTKQEVVDKIIELLTVHTYIENEVMPRARAAPDLEDDVLELRHVADVLVVELAAMKPTDERFTAKTTVLIENVRHHVEEEEQDWFPQVREGLGRKTLQELGAEMLRAKEKAPRRPSQPSALKKTIDAVRLLTRPRAVYRASGGSDRPAPGPGSPASAAANDGTTGTIGSSAAW